MASGRSCTPRTSACSRSCRRAPGEPGSSSRRRTGAPAAAARCPLPSSGLMADGGVYTLGPDDEGRHPPGPEELWGESWYLDWGAADCSYGGYVRLGLYPNLRRAWWWIALVGEQRPLVLVIDHDLPCPEGAIALDQTTDATDVSI